MQNKKGFVLIRSSMAFLWIKTNCYRAMGRDQWYVYLHPQLHLQEQTRIITLKGEKVCWWGGWVGKSTCCALRPDNLSLISRPHIGVVGEMTPHSCHLHWTPSRDTHNNGFLRKCGGKCSWGQTGGIHHWKVMTKEEASGNWFVF